MNYYNENDPKAAAKLRALVKHGLLPDGHVDDRSICDVKASDLIGYTQHHFFCGYGGWPLALEIAGWPEHEPIWTGSCPCQPFSCAGKQKGTEDERHLWPEMSRLAREYRPAIITGEQVASAIGKGWLDIVSGDLEGHDYAVGASVFKACSCGSPTERERLYWLAASNQRPRGKGLVARTNTRFARQRHWGGKEDLRELYARPTERGDMWPQPIIRRVDDGLSGRVAELRGYGNAVDINAATMFIRAIMEIL